MNLVKKMLGDKVEYYPASATASDFEYITTTGKSLKGVEAIDRLADDFPDITKYMPMLPPKYKKAGLKVAYKVGSIVRKTYSTVKRGCNCGKH